MRDRRHRPTSSPRWHRPRRSPDVARPVPSCTICPRPRCAPASGDRDCGRPDRRLRALVRSRGDRCDRLAGAAGRDRRARALQRAGPYRLGGLGDGLAGCGRGRCDDRLRHAAQFDIRRSSRRRHSPRSARRPRRVDLRLRAVGRPGSRPCRRARAAGGLRRRSASRRSCARAASTTSRRWISRRCGPACAARPRSACRSPCTPRSTRGRRRRRERGTVASYLASRPVEWECDAIRAALDLAGETGCALHIVHVSSGRGLALVA